MDLMQVFIATGVVAGLGLIIGLLLGFAGKILTVEVNEKEIAIRECLPGVNCGACGYAGCDAYAEAVANGKAKNNLCVVAGSDGAKSIACIMGQEAGEVARLAAKVRCNGNCDVTGAKYVNDGTLSCELASTLPGGGQQQCSYACLGYGSCVKACPQHCIHMENGVAVVDQDECIACGKCVATCPKNLIEIQTAGRAYTVRCSSHDAGKTVKAVCSTGCIGCGICAKVCPTDAITLDDHLAYIHEDTCIGCGACAEKCPVNIIF